MTVYVSKQNEDLTSMSFLELGEEPEINPCRGCLDYDGKGGCKSNGGCGAKIGE